MMRKLPKPEDIPPLERKLERLIDTAWRGTRQLFKYLMKTPRNKYEKWDKLFLTWSITIPFTMFVIAILLR